LNRLVRLLAVGLILLSPWASWVWAQARGVKPLCMGPPSYDNGRCFRELFEHPDQWQQTRAAIDTLIYADHCLHKQFTDDQLRTWLPMLKKWGIKFELEVGAVKPWGLTAEKTFSIERPMWDRVVRLGSSIHAIAMDEPFCCARFHIHKPDDYVLQETARFIAMVRKQYPDMLIGDIETYPSIPLGDHFWWIESLQKRLAEMGVRRLDFYRLDVNWAVFTAFNQGSWLEVRKLEQYCRKAKLPFSLTYWASDEPVMKKRGLADDSTWYVSIMRQGYDYALVQGSPDEYVVQSWLDAPAHSVPETDPWTFTRSVLDFSRKFVKRGP